MSGKDDPIAAAIDDARAFMDSLLQSDWQELHIAGDGFELFIARDDGGSNPMFEREPAVEPEKAAQAAELTEISAPHVATVSWLPELHANIAAGEPVVRLSVLGDEIEVPAVSPGQVLRIDVAEGDMVEFGMIILQMTIEAS